MTYGEYCESYDGSENFSSLSSLCATPCLVLPRASHVDAVDIFLSSIYIGFQGKYFFFLFGYVIMSHMLHFYVLYGSLLLACRMGNFFLFICVCFS